MSDEKADIIAPPQSFANFLLRMDGGDFHGRLSSELQEFIGDLRDHLRDTGEKSCKGKMTIVFDFVVDAGDAVEIKPSMQCKLPKPPMQRSFMWIGQGDQLTPHNPRQQQLPFNEIRAPRGTA